MCGATRDVRFSNRPVWVKRFQTVHDYGVDVARGLVLLFGIAAAARLGGDSTQILGWARRCAGDILWRRWDDVDAVATALLLRKTLTGDELSALLGWPQN